MDRIDWPLNWITSSSELKLTGIRFQLSLQKTVERNWELVNNHILGILTNHAARNMTIEHRNNFIKAFCLSRAKILECPSYTSNKILVETQRFLWYVHLERPERGVSYQDKKNGGIEFRNPALLFKALLVKTFLNDLFGD